MAQKFTVPVTVKQLSSSGSDAITVFVDADTYARLKIEAGGRLTWGSGSGAGDTNLYRDSADTLKTDDNFNVAGKLSVLASSGDEGGEIFLAQAQTNSTLDGGVTIDVYQNKIRFFEQGGSARGAYIDLTAASGGAGTNLLSGGGGATNLDGLTDVTITSAEEFQSLTYNGTAWVNNYAPTVTYVRNAEATTLTTGTVVYLFGATGDHASVKRADNDSDTTSSKTIGLVAANIAASQNGPVVTRGYVDGIDLSSGYTAGDILWLGEDGGFTTTKPTSPEHLVFVGVVVRATNNGIVYVATQNGYELDELHNVSAGSPSAGDFLKYDGSLWVNDPINLGTDTVGNYMTDVSAGTGISISHTPGEGSTATITNAGVTSLNGSTGAITGVVKTSDTGTVTSTMIADGTIVNADIDSSAAIALSKLASGTSAQVVIANSSGVPTYTTLSGDVTVSNTGVVTIAANSVALGTDTTGDYVSSLIAGNGITLSNNSGEGSTPTVTVNYAAVTRDSDIRFLMEVV